MVIKYKTTFILFILFAILSACTNGLNKKTKLENTIFQKEFKTKSPPQWVIGKDHPDYPIRHYIIGRGISNENSISAAENARTDLAKSIKVNIRSKMMDYSTNQWTNIQSVVESEVKAVLEGVEIRDGWFDSSTKNYYAYAVMNRKLASQRLINRILIEKDRINWFLIEGTNSVENNDIASALSLFTSGYKHARSLESLIAMSNIINRKNEKKEIIQLHNQQIFEKKVKNILREISLSIESGDRQSVQLSKIPDNPLKIKLFWTKNLSRVPLVGMPVKFEYSNGAGVLDENVLTDNNGIAKSTIKKIISYKEIDHKVSVGLNLNKILPGIKEADLPSFFDQIKNLKVEFNINVETTNNFSAKSKFLQENLFNLAKQIVHNINPDSKHVLGIFSFKNFQSGESTHPLSRVIKRDFENILSGVEGLVLREIRYSENNNEDKSKLAKDNNLDIYVTGGYRLISDNIEIRVRLIETSTNNILGFGKISMRIQDIYSSNIEDLENINSHRSEFLNNNNYDELKETLVNLSPKYSSFNLKVKTNKTDYHVGEKLNFLVETDRSCYLTLLDFSPDGIITVLFPNGNHENNLISSNKTYKIPPNKSLGSNKAFSLMIQEPSGLDRIKAFCHVQKSPTLNLVFKNRADYHTIKPQTKQGKKDLKFYINTFNVSNPSQWAEAYNEVYIFKKGITYMRGKKSIPILEKPKKPMDMIGSFGNEIPIPHK
jgi:TolB-like protein